MQTKPLLFFLAAVPLFSQWDAQPALLGRIIAPEGAALHRLRVQCLPFGSRTPDGETNPTPSGHFELRARSSGLHEIRILSLDGTLMQSLTVNLPSTNTFEIDLRQGFATGPVRPVSLSRLQHKIPKKAQKEFAAAHLASEKGQSEIAAHHLELALASDPDYFEAINNLAVQYVRLNRLNEAKDLFVRATRLDPADALAEMNLAFVLLRLGDFPAAEQAARASLRADAASSRARLYLALSLLEQKKQTNEAIFHLGKATELEPARRLLNQLQFKK